MLLPDIYSCKVPVSRSRPLKDTPSARFDEFKWDTIETSIKIIVS